jgi:hypothetical protein
VVFGDNLCGAPDALEYIISPNDVIGFDNPPNPANVYVGIFNAPVEKLNVDDSLLPVVVNVICVCFELNVVQFAADKNPSCKLLAC